MINLRTSTFLGEFLCQNGRFCKIFTDNMSYALLLFCKKFAHTFCRRGYRRNTDFMLKYLMLLLAGLPVAGQAETADSLRPVLTLPLQADYATADRLSNSYVLTNNVVVKYDSTGRKTAEYSNRRLGGATLIDATNPLKIMVLYPDFQTAVLLDRTLTEMGRLNFNDLGYPAVRTACVTPDGNLWIYDDLTAKALKLSLDGTVLFESQPLNLLFAGFAPARIRDNGQQVFLSDPKRGLCILDQYARIITADASLTFGEFETEEDWLIAVWKNNLTFDKPALHQFLKLPLPDEARLANAECWLGVRRLFVQSGGELRVYSW